MGKISDEFRMRSLEQENELLVSIIEKNPAGVAVYEWDGERLHLSISNERARNAMGRRDEQRKELLVERIHEEDSSKFLKAIHEILLGEGHAHCRFRYRTGDDGVYSFIDFDGTLLEAGGDRRLIDASICDVTERMKKDAKLGSDLKRSLKAVIEFAQTALSHPEPERKDAYLDKISIAGEYLLGTIEDNFGTESVETEKIKLDIRPLFDEILIDNIVSEAREILKEKHILLKVRDETILHQDVYVDAVKIQDIFLNIVRYAARFIPADGVMETNINILSHEKGRVSFSVTISDNGAGMTEEFIKNYFEPLAKGSSGDGDASGEIYALSTARRLVEAMHGSFDVSNTLGEGSAFTVVLSCEVRPRQSFLNRAAKARDAHISGARVLVVDDQPLNTQLAARLLKKKNMEADTATDGPGAIKLFDESEEGYYDAVLVDMEMPGMDGAETVRRIKLLTRADVKNTAFIAMTADVSEGADHKAVGFDECIEKPIRAEALYTAIEKTMGR